MQTYEGISQSIIDFLKETYNELSETRLRRLRYNKIIREMFEDIKIFPQDLIYPIFICRGSKH